MCQWCQWPNSYFCTKRNKQTTISATIHSYTHRKCRLYRHFHLNLHLSLRKFFLFRFFSFSKMEVFSSSCTEHSEPCTVDPLMSTTKVILQIHMLYECTYTVLCTVQCALGILLSTYMKYLAEHLLNRTWGVWLCQLHGESGCVTCKVSLHGWVIYLIILA